MMMGKIVADKKRYRAYKARKHALPDTYRRALDGTEHYVYYFASSDVDALMSLLENLADLFEQSSADGTTIADIVGDDPIEFAEEFLRSYPEASWITKARSQFRSEVDKAIAAQNEAGDHR
ncbi:hypothetical protein A5785_13060 [Gordonia sp. 852002-50395_SCH5434458]|nr:hypothetical protein A5785_13060 [Gordonia sp. 852002-50395_SCH5434458]